MDVVDGNNAGPSDEKGLRHSLIANSALADGIDYGEIEELDDCERPGRFYGPDGTWLFMTRGDRKVANSLDQAECNDLSLHLYNAHALKRRLYPNGGDLRALAWKSKLSWVQADDLGHLPFKPAVEWTAWPLHPEDVPRRRETWGAPTVWPDDEPDNFAKATPWKPSQYLKDELQATVLREAHRKFQERLQHRRRDASMDTRTDNTSQRSPQLSPAPPTGRGSRRHPDQQRDSLTVYEDLPGKSTPTLREGDVAEHHSENARDYSAEFTQQSVPLFMSDDEKAATILEPTINDCLSRLDDLLGGLHRSLYYRNASNARNAKSKKPYSRKSSRQEDSSSFLDGETASKVAPSQIYKRRRVNLDCRDWSEIIAIASMAKWDPDVVSNAARRCASLFRESMELCTIPRNGVGPSNSGTARQYTPDMASPLHVEQGNDSTSGALAWLQEQQISYCPGYRCPHTDCERHKIPYNERWALRQHLKRSHKHSLQEAEDIVADAMRNLRDQKSATEGIQHPQFEDNLLAPITITMPWSRQR